MTYIRNNIISFLFYITVNCVWNDWTANWTDCSQDCGGGMQYKSRHKLIEAQHNGQECVGEAQRVQECNMTACTDGKGK